MRHDVAPVTGGVTDRQQHGLAGLARMSKCLVTPRVPVDRVVGMLLEVRAGFFGEAIWHGLIYDTGF